MLTLDTVESGRLVRVVRIHGGRRLVHRLSTLGLVPGAVVTVTRRRGPAIVSVRGARMVVGRGAAMAIELEEVEE
jgi:Fe2+ transport system protein FeoA